MTITTRLNKNTSRLHTLVKGTLNYRDFLTHIEETRPRLAPSWPELFDAREALTDLTTAEIKDLCYAAQAAATRDKIGPTAIIATNDLLYGLARMYSGLCGGHANPIEVFREIRSAEDWLGSLEAGTPAPKATSVRRATPVLSFPARRFGVYSE
jgi:hypothetical protein